MSAGNYRYDSRDFFKGGLKAKFNANLAAIRTLQAIQAEGRDTATPEEQAILSKYVGWGQFPALFNAYSGDWQKERQTLEGLLSPEEFAAARRSTLNAHFTHPDVVDAHWKMAERLGFKGGRFLETSAGIGYYLGMMPGHLAAKTRSSAVELDTTTGNMLKMLYPKANVKVQGFEKFKAPDGFYDLIASNVPFGDYRVHDPEYNKHQANIHDYFFLKSVDKVRPGGLVMHITSTGTMDKADDRIRQELAKKCDLVSAIRFPGGAHKENAGTEVVTDMLILRRRLPGEEPSGHNWMETTTVADPAGGEPIPVNRYFAEHPEQILGTLDRTGSMYHGASVNVSKTEDYEQRLQAAIDRLPQGLMKPSTVPQKRLAPESMPEPGDVKLGGFKVENGKIFVRDKDGMVEHGEQLSPKETEKLQAHLTLRDAVRATLNAQLKGEDATEARATLNRVYDDFVKKHGYVNAPANKRLFRSDPDSPVLLALEKWDAKKKKGEKADIFSKDTVRSVAPVEKAGSVHEAVGVSLHERGGVDLDHIAKLTSKPHAQVAKELVESGLAYEDPGEGWKPADQYLSGNVRRKLAMAKAAAETDPKYKANVEALEKVQPEDVDHTDIEARLGAAWVPPSDIAAFAGHLLGGSPEHFNVKYTQASGWLADFSRSGQVAVANSKTAREVWGTARKDFDEILEAALNNSPLMVYDTDNEGNRTFNKDATADAQAKAQEMKDAFSEWLWTDDERRQRLHRYYNDNFNNIREMKYDGSHLKFPGMNPSVKLHKHIPNFVWQVVTTGKGLAAHEVGMGKTYAMIASAMELRRLGLARKPAIACLKANIEQITADALKLYPGAKILSTADMFDAQKRKKTISQIATGDYDMVILTHDHMDLLRMKPETVKSYINDEIAELTAAKTAMLDEDPKAKNGRAMKALEKAQARLEAKLEEALDVEGKDDAVYFEDTGIDHLFVDEAHKYKSLPVYTKQTMLKGVPNSRSDRATNMQMRSRWLQEQNNGRGVVFATGTPVANTMAELYNMQRYLQPKELKERGLDSFDAWASTFGDVQTKMEITASGEYKPVSRFAKFVNIPELMQTARQVMDVQRIDSMVGTTVVRPKRHDHVVTSPKSDSMARLMENLKQRAKDVSTGGPPQEGADNMLTICTDGRKGALDMRLLDPTAPDDPESKTNQAIANVLKLHKEKPGATQLIFSDIGVHPTSGSERAGGGEGTFHLYADIIDKLVKGGIPREKIADFSQLEGAKKEAAMEAMRKGEILIGLGSTDKMGTGVNVQDKVAALHHLDVPWLPASVEQRDGRGWRHGNANKDVNIYRYVTEGSLDQMFWQIIGNKQRFISQVVKPSGALERTANDEDTEQLTPDQLMAAASGDPRILEKVQLDEDIRQLKSGEKRHLREQVKFKDSISAGERQIPQLERRAKAIREDAKVLEANPEFSLTIDGKTYTDRKEAAAAFDAKSAEIDKDTPSWQTNKESTIGEFRGLQWRRRGQKHYLASETQEYSTGGSLGSLEAVARKLGKDATAAENEVVKAREDLERVKSNVGKAFPKADQLKEKLARVKKLEEELAPKKEEEQAAEIKKLALGQAEAVLVNGWKIKPANGRVELLGPSFFAPDLMAAGIVKDRYGLTGSRFFVPNGSRGITVLKNLTKKRPIAKIG